MRKNLKINVPKSVRTSVIVYDDYLLDYKIYRHVVIQFDLFNKLFFVGQAAFISIKEAKEFIDQDVNERKKKMAFHVFWGCRYIENGCGFERFETKEEALAFINKLNEDERSNLRIFEGRERKLKPVVIVKKFDLEPYVGD